MPKTIAYQRVQEMWVETAEKMQSTYSLFNNLPGKYHDQSEDYKALFKQHMELLLSHWELLNVAENLDDDRRGMAKYIAKFLACLLHVQDCLDANVEVGARQITNRLVEAVADAAFNEKFEAEAKASKRPVSRVKEQEISSMLQSLKIDPRVYNPYDNAAADAQNPTEGTSSTPSASKHKSATKSNGHASSKKRDDTTARQKDNV